MAYKRRLYFVFAIIIGFALYLLIYYGALMAKGTPPPPVRQASGLAERGAILDRNGRFLAIQIRLANISVWRPSVNIELLSSELAPILGMTPSEINDRINASETNFLYLKRNVDDVIARQISSIVAEKRLHGVRVEPVVGRIYPENSLASQIIGFAGSENRGLAGIEFAFNNVLSGAETEGKGSQVVLTIDTNVQHILEQIAIKTMNETGAEAVMLQAMDSRTGEILGSASIPNFDPNNFRAFSETSRMDRPAIWAYEPGSVFKVFTIAGLMDMGAISANTSFFCNGVYERTTSRGEKIEIKCLGNHGSVNARDIIVHSCNAGAGYASDRWRSGSFYSMLRDYGFGSRTGAGSPGETAGYLQQSAFWSERSKPTLALGQ
jgi:cell division protein FtsI (penicillin-binding protein 3)